MKKFIFAAALVLGLLYALPSEAQVQCPAGVLGCGTGGGGGIVSGASVPTCTAYSIVSIDASGNLACTPNPVVNGSVSTAGRSILTIRDTLTDLVTSNFLNITGTLFTGGTVPQKAVFVSITGSNANSEQYAIHGSLDATSSVNGHSVGVVGQVINGVGSGGATGVQGESFINSGGKVLIGGRFGATSVNNGSATSKNFGLFAYAGDNGGTPLLNNGVQGGARQTAATNAIGGYFFLDSTAYNSINAFDPFATLVGTAALVADNRAIAANIFEARDNGTATSTTAASANVAILDGAQMRLGNMALTSSTATPTIVAEARTVTHSYAWTNAMVVALGAVLTGDIPMVTLPAKTQVERALVVIDTAAGGPTTLTVSCGDATVGTPFVNYILPGDAKAAANTVYGDAITGAETGASLFDATAKWVKGFLPSYTTTTLVTCHFIATVANLNATTTSTGRLILQTTLLP